MMQDCIEEKRKLVEKIGVHIERTRQLPPLASRVFALLILCPKSGHSFDEIVELSESSKSSVSTSINLLLKMGRIEYFTKPGDRKRYFRLSKNYLKGNLKSSRKGIDEELRLMNYVDEFNKKFNTEKYKKHRELGCLYRSYLLTQKENLEKIIEKMNQLEETI